MIVVREEGTDSQAKQMIVAAACVATAGLRLQVLIQCSSTRDLMVVYRSSGRGVSERETVNKQYFYFQYSKDKWRSENTCRTREEGKRFSRRKE